MNKLFQRGAPSTYVMGARIARHPITGLPITATSDEKVGRVTVQRAGQPKWNRAKPVQMAIHFRNEAAKRRTEAKVKADNIPEAAIKLFGLATYANPKDLVKVPVYTGVPQFLATRARAVARRDAPRAAA